MDYWNAILLGILQGATEFLPVSSSGHLVLAEELLSMGKPGFTEELFFHLGTLVATVMVFRRDIAMILAAIFRYLGRAPRESDRAHLRLACMIVVATAVTGAIGLAFEDLLASAFEGTLAVGVALMATAGVLWCAGRPRFRAGTRGTDAIGIRDALLVGLAQAAAPLPGISRSGTTISVAMMLGITRDAAARFSFLLSVPAILGANLVVWIRSSATEAAGHTSRGALIVGAVAAGLAGWIALKLLIRILTRTALVPFSYYCAGLGIAAIIWHIAR